MLPPRMLAISCKSRSRRSIAVGMQQQQFQQQLPHPSSLDSPFPACLCRSFSNRSHGSCLLSRILQTHTRHEDAGGHLCGKNVETVGTVEFGPACAENSGHGPTLHGKTELQEMSRGCCPIAQVVKQSFKCVPYAQRGSYVSC